MADLVAASGGLLCPDADFTVQYVQDTLIPLVSNSRKRNQMANAAKAVGVKDGAERLLNLVHSVLGARKSSI